MNSELYYIKEDLYLLRSQLWRLAGIFFFCIMLLAVLFFIKSRFDVKLRQLGEEYQQMQMIVEQFYEDQTVLEDYLERYQKLSETGLTQAENRLYFFESVRNIRELNSLYPISVELGKQSSKNLEYGEDIIFPGDTVALTNSKIKMQLPMLHEGGLIDLLESIENMGETIFPVSCKMLWNVKADDGLLINEPNLIADCEFQWVGFNLQPDLADSNNGEFYDDFD